MSTLGNGVPYDFPLELIDEVIAGNQDDIAFLRSVSLVSKIWRAAALRYLFSEASFLCKNDFIRWGLICASLPHVAQYVRKVVVNLGAIRRLQDRAKSARTGFVGRAKASLTGVMGIPVENIEGATTYTKRLFPTLDCTFPKDSDFEVVLPTMSNATSLDWTMPSTKDGFNPTSANTTRFLSSFPNITHLSYSSHLLRTEVQGHFMSFFQNLRKCTFAMWGGSDSEPLYVFSARSRISISQLEEIWFDDCELGSMDWLLNVLDNSPSPIRIRKLGWKFGDPPFLSSNFARLLGITRGALEELCFGPPWTPDDQTAWNVDLQGFEAPPFTFNDLPVLQILSFRVLHISIEPHLIMQWLNSIFVVFPSCPCLQRLELTFYLTDSLEVENVFAFGFLDWNWLLEDHFPSLKVLEFEIMVEYEEDFDTAERKRKLEILIRQNTQMVKSEKFVIRWSAHAFDDDSSH